MTWRRSVAGIVLIATAAGVAALAPPLAAGASGYSGVLFRPVLCAVPPFDRFITTHQPAASASSCGSDLLSAASLAVTPDGSSQGFSFSSPQLDTILEGFKTTKPAADSPKKVVLLPGLRGSSIFSATPASQSTRYVLGPSEMNSSAIASATATQTKSGAWVVDWTTTSSGASQWDKIAHLNFHQILAVDVGGVVVSAPIIEPTDKSFKSFHGQGVISGDLSHAEAMRIVQAMESQNG